MGRAGRGRRRELPRAGVVPPRAFGVLSREAGGCRPRVRRRRRRSGGHRTASAHGEGRAEGDDDAGQPDRHASVRAARRDRAHLLDERHDGHAELHPPHGGRPRQLGDRIGAELLGLGRLRRGAGRDDVRRRAVRRRSGARFLRPARPVSHPRRDREHPEAHGGDRAPEAERRSLDAVVRGAPRGVGERARDRPRLLDCRAPARRRRAGWGRARLSGAAGGGLGRARHRGHGDRRHRHLALGRV